MKDETTCIELLANLCRDPGFVMVSQDRYEELIHAEVERDMLELTIEGKNCFSSILMMEAIKAARKAQYGG